MERLSIFPNGQDWYCGNRHSIPIPIYGLKPMPIKFWVTFFLTLEKKPWNFKETHETLSYQSSLEYKNSIGSITIINSMLCFRVLAIK